MKTGYKLGLIVGLALDCSYVQSCALHEHNQNIFNKHNLFVNAELGGSLPAALWGDKKDYFNKASSAFVYGGGIGYRFTKHIDGEISIHNRTTYKYSGKNIIGQETKQDFSFTTLMFSGYYTHPVYVRSVGRFVSPYIMAGVGTAFNRAGAYTNEQKDVYPSRNISSFAMQVGFGVKVKTSNNTSLNLGYKYVDGGLFMARPRDIGKGVHVAPAEGHAKTHEILAGITYRF